MSHRTAVLTSFEKYLAIENYSPDVRAEEQRDREGRLVQFPYAVMLQVSYAELDFANRWCWQRFGPIEGPCLQQQSDYPSCDVTEPHSHAGKWIWHWFAKTDYNFGFCEWYFTDRSERDSFLASLRDINWGEKYS